MDSLEIQRPSEKERQEPTEEQQQSPEETDPGALSPEEAMAKSNALAKSEGETVSLLPVTRSAVDAVKPHKSIIINVCSFILVTEVRVALDLLRCSQEGP